MAFDPERQVDWFEGMEGAFLRFGGVPTEMLFDNARALVEHHDAALLGGRGDLSEPVCWGQMSHGEYF